MIPRTNGAGQCVEQVHETRKNGIEERGREGEFIAITEGTGKAFENPNLVGKTSLCPTVIRASVVVTHRNDSNPPHR